MSRMSRWSCVVVAMASLLIPAAARELSDASLPESGAIAQPAPQIAAAVPKLAGPACHSDCVLKNAMCETACLEGADAASCRVSQCEPVQRQCTALCMPQQSIAEACATRDRAVVALIEQQGVLLDGAPNRLAEAYVTVVRARGECVDGQVHAALADYERAELLLRATDEGEDELPDD
jgi:hypothetical protein